MKLSALSVTALGGAAALGVGQMLLPTARAQPAPAPVYSARLEKMQVKHRAGSLQITGRVINTGNLTLTYTSVAAVLTSAGGVEIGHGPGYLTAGPLRPGQSAELRADVEAGPANTAVTLVLREAGHPVTLETAPLGR